jgi:predicted N-formylglutamate amidohydrolase
LPETRVYLLSCEHGGNQVPPEYQPLFAACQSQLESHRGYDPGALPLARFLAKGLRASLLAAKTTRLLVDLNRSCQSWELFSAVSRQLSPEQQRKLLADYYQPYRTEVESRVRKRLALGRQVIHLSVHTFTPFFDGQPRQTDIGLLYDPARAAEGCFCHLWGELLKPLLNRLRIAYNDPYRGIEDGLTRSLRERFGPQDYLGIELEVSQGLLGIDTTFPFWLQNTLLDSLRQLLPDD